MEAGVDKRGVQGRKRRAIHLSCAGPESNVFAAGHNSAKSEVRTCRNLKLCYFPFPTLSLDSTLKNSLKKNPFGFDANGPSWNGPPAPEII